MSRQKFIALRLSTAIVALFAGCSSGSPTSGTQSVSDAQVNADVANATAPDAAGDAADFTDNSGAGVNFDVAAARRGGMLMGSMVAAAGPCGPTTIDSVVYVNESDTVDFTRTREWFGNGACQVAYDSTSTDSVEFVGMWDVALHDAAGNWSRHASRDRHASLAGNPTLHAATSHVWNANALVHDTVHFVGAVNTRAYSGTAYDTATAVTFNHPRNGEVYPESGTWRRWGTWTLNVSGAKTETKTVQRHVVVTFANGSNDVALQIFNIETGGVALTCTLDLLAHRVVPGTCH